MHPAALPASLVLALGAGPGLAAPAAYDLAFVSAFAEACVPERLSFEGTKATALKAGWSAVGRDANQELDAMLAISEQEMLASDLEEAQFDYATYAKPIDGLPHFLVVSRASSVIGDADDPLNPWVYIGCYLYNFDAAAPIDPEAVTALIGNPIAAAHTDMHINGWVWGPPCSMPRTGDTYLSFIPEVSQYRDKVGFSGLVLKFDTSEPDPGTVIPETYC